MDAGSSDAGGDRDDAGLADGGPIDAGRMDWPAERPPAATVRDGVRREVLQVPASEAPANPVSGEETPDELQRTQLVRYRRDVDPPAEVRAIVVAMPGFLGGGPSFEGLAHDLVAEGLGEDDVEVWAIDRRSNLLEDLRGMDAAEAAGDPEIATGYYFGSDTVGGEAFAGYADSDELGFMSEWGLATHVNDVRALIETVPEAERVERVFLMGHSLGASFAEAYSAWRFEDGVRGFEELAGVILVDGILSGEPIEESAFREGSTAGGFPSPGIDGLRDGSASVYTVLPLLGIDVYAQAEIGSLRVLLDPDAVVEDFGRDRTLATLTSLRPSQIPAMSNEAALALAFDDSTVLLDFVGTKLGSLVGPTEEYATLFGGMSLRPSDPDATYTWTDAYDADPPEPTPIAALSRAFADGRTNFAEWYFPSRLPLDISAVGGAAIAEDGWQADEGLRAFDGAENDAPILCVAAGLVGVDAYDAIPGRVATEVGAGRPAAGATREDGVGLVVLDATEQAHLDPVLAPESENNPVPEAVRAFLDAHAAAGTSPVPTVSGSGG